MKRTCLIVDDSLIVRRIAANMIEPLGFDCAQAQDGREALAFCAAHMPHVILLDWNMPVMDGPSFLRALRVLPGGDNPVVIFCTTHNDMDHIRQAIAQGADEYIMKPFDAEMIRDKFAQTGLLKT